MLKRFKIDQPSMTPALQPGDAILAIRTTRPPRRGEIIVFELPDGMFVVKRVVALSHETVSAAGGVISINGKQIDRWGVGLTTPIETAEIPAGHVWVLGDRREVSATDSRALGPIPVGTWWRAWFRYGPVSRRGRIR